MSKLSIGKAEDLATTVLLAAAKYCLIPAMNVRMWLHKATQSNLKILQEFGYLFVGPEEVKWLIGSSRRQDVESRQIFSYLKIILIKEILLKIETLKP